MRAIFATAFILSAAIMPAAAQPAPSPEALKDLAPTGKLRAAMLETLAREPLAATEYVSCADPATLQELDAISGPALLSMAVRFGSVRLIDNEPLPGGNDFAPLP